MDVEVSGGHILMLFSFWKYIGCKFLFFIVVYELDVISGREINFFLKIWRIDGMQTIKMPLIVFLDLESLGDPHDDEMNIVIKVI